MWLTELVQLACVTGSRPTQYLQSRSECIGLPRGSLCTTIDVDDLPLAWV